MIYIWLKNIGLSKHQRNLYLFYWGNKKYSFYSNVLLVLCQKHSGWKKQKEQKEWEQFGWDDKYRRLWYLAKPVKGFDTCMKIFFLFLLFSNPFPYPSSISDSISVSIFFNFTPLAIFITLIILPNAKKLSQ